MLASSLVKITKTTALIAYLSSRAVVLAKLRPVLSMAISQPIQRQ
jgi:hypothetical protein